MAKDLFENLSVLIVFGFIAYGMYLFLYQPDVFTAYLGQVANFGNTTLKDWFTKANDFLYETITFLANLN